MSSDNPSALIIGCGVIGTACAHYLVEAGFRVTMIDAQGFGQGCSQANCGLICPSHVLPLAEPGAVWRALFGMLQPNAPLRIKLRLDPQLAAWFLRFAWRCNRRDMLEAGRHRQALLQSSLHLYGELREEVPLDCQWRQRGLLFAYQSEAELERYAETDQLLREYFDEPASRHDGGAVRQIEPALKPGLAGGWYYESDAHLRPEQLLASWRRGLEGRGVKIRENCELRDFAERSGRANSAVTSEGDLAADVFVVATGAWTPQLHRPLGCRVPIQPGKGYSITTSSPKPSPTVPLIFPECKVAVTPFEADFRLGSTMEFAGYDTSLNPQRLELLRRGAERFLEAPYGDEERDRWYGWRPMTFDGLPIIDRSPRFDNVWIAAGHNMLGLSMAPATGKLVAELVTGSPPHVTPEPFRLR
ncbi:MAG: FAD-dependent oxidoreductase [Planctomycetes bacterium]|nr:FAD-dependent oxidoreductase [Planctomycetota bacterium]